MLAIRNFGHFWNRELVNWGSQGRGGTGDLMGFVRKDRIAVPVNFREQIGIYVLYTQNREVVYVGQAGSGTQRLFLRLRQHCRDHLRDRWTHFSWFGFRGINQDCSLSERHDPDSRCDATNREALHEIEAVLLQLFEPRLNKRGPNWGDGTVEYFQYLPWEHEEGEYDPMDEGQHALLDAITAKIDEVAAELRE